MMNHNRLWLAALLSFASHGAVFGAIVVVSLLPSFTPPQLIEAYGDSDREGFPVATVAVNPGAWREGDEHTPGGDEAPEPLLQQERPEFTPAAPEPAAE